MFVKLTKYMKRIEKFSLNTATTRKATTSLFSTGNHDWKHKRSSPQFSVGVNSREGAKNLRASHVEDVTWNVKSTFPAEKVDNTQSMTTKITITL